MLEEDDRLIIVDGMAHSGTTILTYVLSQHPNIVCWAEGSEKRLLENPYLLKEQDKPIQRLLDKFLTKKILLKRPWSCVFRADWLQETMPNARYLYCLRSFEDISASWSKSNSILSKNLWQGGLTYQRDYYDWCWQLAMKFSKRVPYFKVISHVDFLIQPAQMMNDIAEWLGLAPWKWDVSKVSTKINIKNYCVNPHNLVRINFPNRKLFL